MKSKFLILIVAAGVLISCGSKKTVANTSEPEVIKQEVAKSPEVIEGKNLYDNSCGKCHKLYEPKTYTQEQWKPILIRMQKKARLEDAQMALINEYINSEL